MKRSISTEALNHSDLCWIQTMLRFAEEEGSTKPETSQVKPIADNDPDRQWLNRMLSYTE